MNNRLRLKWAVAALVKFILLLLTVSIIAFMLVLFSPNDPIDSYVSKGVSNEQRAVIEANWGLDKPPAVRFVIWLKNVCRGDLGNSIFYSQPVKTVLKSRLNATLLLLGTAWVISGLLGFLLGIIGGVKRGTWADILITRFCLMISSAPVFWIGLLFLMLFSVKLKWFPMGLAAPIGKIASEVTAADRIHHLILPAFTLGITGISKIALHTREKMIDVLNSDYMLFAKARGESEWEAVRRHGIHNIILPALTIQFNSINEIFSGSVLAEQVFTYPGLGNAATQAGLNGDANLLLGVTLISTIIVFSGNLIADLLYGVFDPQIREAKLHE